MIYHILDIFFVIFHTSLIIFNTLGWIWRRTRIINLITLVLTGGSWILLGLICGTLGYCPLTDWHFKILTELGTTNLPSSYIQYLAARLTGFQAEGFIVDRITLYTYCAALALSLSCNFRDLRKKKTCQK